MVLPLGSYDPMGNTIRGNILAGNRFDLVIRLRDSRPGTNCFADNTFSTSDPDQIEIVLPCGVVGTDWMDGPWTALLAPPGRSVRDMPSPPSQPSMPDAGTARPRPAVGVPTFPDPETISVPERS
jgi:hypothetical protein